jgi:hypothetical protein
VKPAIAELTTVTGITAVNGAEAPGTVKVAVTFEVPAATPLSTALTPSALGVMLSTAPASEPA